MTRANIATINRKKPTDVKPKDNTYDSIRVKPGVKEKAAKMLAEVKQGGGARRYTLGDMIEHLLDSVSEQQKAEMRCKTVSPMDRFFAAYEEERKHDPSLSKDEFFQLLMEGKVAFSKSRRAKTETKS